jgi:hypothetical protein
MTEQSAPQSVLPLTPGGAADAIERWTQHDALRDVLAAFDGELPEGGGLDARLEWLVAFSERWDYRAGRERNLVDKPVLAEGVAARVLTAAAALGLFGETSPQRVEYDYALVLGGLARACFARPLHAAHLLRDGAVAVDAVVGLGGYRPLRGDELELVARIVDDELTSEFDAMDAGVRRAFGLGRSTAERGEDSDVVGAAWRVRKYAAAPAQDISVVAAPSTEPGTRRANTGDTYLWFAEHLAKLAPGQRLLLITSDIYVPYQHADALRLLALPFGVEVDTVGIRPGAIDARLAQEFQPHNYLQEIRSTIIAFAKLSAAIGGAERAR